MKKIILLITFLFLSVSSYAFAQPVQRMGLQSQGIQHLIVQYGDELQLTDDQRNELIALQIEHRNQLRSDRGRAVKRDDQGNYRRDSKTNRRDNRRRDFRNSDNRDANMQARAEMRNKVLSILTDEQAELLQDKMIEQTEKAHEFRTFRHEYIVNDAGIEGEKADQVISLLNAQSEARLELGRQRILKTENMDQDWFSDRFQQMSDTDDELRRILTVDEYENLRKNMGIGFNNRPQRNLGMVRGYRMWSR